MQYHNDIVVTCCIVTKLLLHNYMLYTIYYILYTIHYILYTVFFSICIPARQRVREVEVKESRAEIGAKNEAADGSNGDTTAGE